jgi:polar amino acid transport system permease protein
VAGRRDRCAGHRALRVLLITDAIDATTRGSGSGRTRRRAYERRQRLRSTAIGAVSTAALLLALVAVVPRATGWESVRTRFFSREAFIEALPAIWAAIGLNVRIFLIAEVLILVASLAVAVVRSSRSPVLFPLRVLTTAYVHVVRGIPLILVLFLFGFGIPALRLSGVTNDQTFWAIAALVFGYTPYVSEVFRAGIASVHESQRAAARSLGLTNAQTLRHVVLPQATRRVIPPLLNDFVALQKDSALVAFLGPIDAFRRSQIIVSSTFNYTPYLAASLIFISFTVPLALLTDWLIHRQQRRTTVRAVR